MAVDNKLVKKMLLRSKILILKWLKKIIKAFLTLKKGLNCPKTLKVKNINKVDDFGKFCISQHHALKNRSDCSNNFNNFNDCDFNKSFLSNNKGLF